MKYLLIFSLGVISTFAQYRPEVFIREDFKETPAQIPINQGHIANPNLLLTVHGPGKDLIKKSNHDKPSDDPFYVWSGLCEGNWALSLKHSSDNVNLSTFAKVKWRSKQSGFRNLYLIIKLADGSWLIGNTNDGSSKDWRIQEFNISDLDWYAFDIEKILELKPVTNPDLTNVEEIGFTDLMRGGGSIACSRLDWIEVIGFPLKRE